MPLKIDFGCGHNKKDGYVGVDVIDSKDVAFRVDIEEELLPFADETVDEIYTAHTLEHIEDLIRAMNEFWRVLKWGSLLKIHVPHRYCDLAFQDPTHKRFFTVDSMKFFCGDYVAKHRLSYGIRAIFKQVSISLYFPSGTSPEKKKYCTMIEFILRKDQVYHAKYKHVYPFNPSGPFIALSKSYDCEKLARETGVLMYGENKGYTFEYEESMNRWEKIKTKTVDCKQENNVPINKDSIHNEMFNEELIKIGKRAFRKEMKAILAIKVDATMRYGSNPAPLGLKGIFADLNRKFTRLKRWLWEDEKATSENIIDTLYDNAIYSLLAVMRIKEDEKNGHKS
jgi:predicted SAM-dependent methyltransferase